MSGGAVIIRRQNQFIHAFRRAGAVSPDTARSLDEHGLRGSWVFRRMAVRGVFVHTDGGRWYISEPAAAAMKGRAVPLLWASYPKWQLDKSQNNLEEGLLRLLRTMIPEKVPVILLSEDGGGCHEQRGRR